MSIKERSAKRKLPSLVRWILWALLIQFILINISAAFYAYRLTHFSTNPSLRIYKPASNIFVKTWRLFTGPRQPRSSISETPTFSFDTVQFKTSNGTLIDAWYGKADSFSRGTVIFFHGITVTKAQLLHEAYEFRYWHYNVMLVDFRGHGNSSGNKTTIGIKESEEVKLAYEHVINRGDKNIFLYGLSLGSVAAARAAAIYQLPLSGVILDMPFLSLQTYMKGKARIVGFPQQPFAFLTTLWTGIENGFNGFNHKTTTYVKKINCPVLLQWGALDYFVLKDDIAEIYTAIGSKNKKLVIYPNASHESLLGNDPARWRAEVGNFIKSYGK